MAGGGLDDRGGDTPPPVPSGCPPCTRRKGEAGGPLEPKLFLVCAPSFDYGFTHYRADIQREFEAVMGGWG